MKNRVVVGHAISNDLNVLFIHHPHRLLRDTALYGPFMYTNIVVKFVYCLKTRERKKVKNCRLLSKTNWGWIFSNMSMILLMMHELPYCCTRNIAQSGSLLSRKKNIVQNQSSNHCLLITGIPLLWHDFC